MSDIPQDPFAAAEDLELETYIADRDSRLAADERTWTSYVGGLVELCVAGPMIGRRAVSARVVDIQAILPELELAEATGEDLHGVKRKVARHMLDLHSALMDSPMVEDN